MLHICALIGMLACAPPPPPADTGATPAKQFTLHNIHIDEKKADGTVWSGTAKTSEGDLTVNDLTDIDLTITNPDHRAYVVHAPSGTFDFDRDVGTFEQTRVTDASGGVMHGGKSHYDGGAKRIACDGPMRFFTPDLRASAPTATFHLDTGTVEIPGPVIGRFDAGHIKPQ